MKARLSDHRQAHEPIGASVRLVTQIPAGTDGDGIQHMYKALTLPLELKGAPVLRHDVDSEPLLVTLLRREFPWCTEFLDALALQLRIASAVGRPWLAMKPMVLVGPPGIGKTRLARRICELSGVGFAQLSVAGSTDNRTLAGTARGWAATQPNLPILTIHRTRSANPLIVIDEVDKVSDDRRNGNVLDTLLAMLEPETSRRFFDECLLTECNLSYVNWLLTANSADTLPPVLRSRLQLINMEPPGEQHFDALLASIIADTAREWQISELELPLLAPAVVDGLRRGFANTNSVRRFASAVKAVMALSVGQAPRRVQ